VPSEAVMSQTMGPKLLVVAGEAAETAQELPFGIRSLLDAAAEILVVAPSLPGRLQWLMSDTDKATQRADARLRTVLGQLDELGTSAHGQLGADEPLLAFEDAIREFAPDHVLIGLRREGRDGWQERGLLDEILQRFPIPVTVFVLGADSR
jgi:hypothetical protein